MAGHVAIKDRKAERSRSGSAAIEFGLAGPLLLMLLMGVVELSFAIYEGMQVYNSVEAGAIYAVKNGWNVTAISNAVVNATGTTGITATPAPTQFCGCPTAGGILTTSCSATCAGGGPPGEYGEINASLNHSTIVPYPGLSLPTTFTAKSVVRLN